MIFGKEQQKRCARRHTSTGGSTQEGQIEAGTRRRTGRIAGLCESRNQKNRLHTWCVHAYRQSYRQFVGLRFCGGYDVASAGKRSLAAIVASGGPAFPSLAAVGSLLLGFVGTKAGGWGFRQCDG